MRRAWVLLVVLVLLVSVSGLTGAQVEATGKLKEVLDRGKLLCGVNGTVPGFSFLNPDTGEMVGFDADFCRALAAAIFGEADLKADFGPVIFYDGQGLMVRTDLGVSSIEDLNGSSICTLAGTTTEVNITDAMTSRGFEFELIPFETSADSMSGFEAGRCDVLTSDKSQLAGLRSAANDPSQYVILNDTLSKEPLAPSWLEGDAQWGNVVRWVVYATFQAEEFGITQANAAEMAANPPNPEIERFVGAEAEGALGGFLGLSPDFAVNVIKAVGNYGEIYERHITPVGIAREGTANAQWRDGGLIFAPAWR
ncbi:MAG: transporter substrate-binding domain-containing protein [Chloroflexi bacterium]|nr:transporter substrate-binding domain-containing protein [Chloroflexota bacterium]